VAGWADAIVRANLVRGVGGKRHPAVPCTTPGWTCGVRCANLGVQHVNGGRKRDLDLAHFP
jgi:hypothetical protein